MRVTITDVARRAGVSKSTVSKVLNGYPTQPETARRVKAAAKALGYHPHALARALPFGRTNMIAALVQKISGPFVGPIFEGIQSVADQHGMQLLVCDAHTASSNKSSYTNLIQGRLADGFILINPGKMDDEVVARLDGNRFPTVAINSSVMDENVSSVVVDNFTGACTATRHLLDLGHRDIGFILGPPEAEETKERLRGIRTCLDEFGLSFDPSQVIHGVYDPPSGFRSSAALLDASDNLTAIFSACDLMASGAIKLCRQRGIKIPDDIALVGFDDLEIASIVTPSLTTIRQPLREMGQVAAQKLIHLLSGDSRLKTKTVLPVQLVVRESCGAQIENMDNLSLYTS